MKRCGAGWLSGAFDPFLVHYKTTPIINCVEFLYEWQAFDGCSMLGWHQSLRQEGEGGRRARRGAEIVSVVAVWCLSSSKAVSAYNMHT